MNAAGIDAHATYLVVTLVSKHGELLVEPTRIANPDASELLKLLDRHGPVEVVVETSPAWPWLFEGGSGELRLLDKPRLIGRSEGRRQPSRSRKPS